MPTKASDMLARILVVALISFGLISCASAQEGGRGPIAWDGLGRNPNLPAHPKPRVNRGGAVERNPNIEREKLLTTLRPYSKAWWAVHDEIEAENERRLSTKLMICRQCAPAAPEDRTGTIR